MLQSKMILLEALHLYYRSIKLEGSLETIISLRTHVSHWGI